MSVLVRPNEPTVCNIFRIVLCYIRHTRTIVLSIVPLEFKQTVKWNKLPAEFYVFFLSQEQEISCSLNSLEQVWGSTSLFFNVHCVYWQAWSGRGLTTYFYIVSMLRMNGTVHLFSFYVFLALTGTAKCFHISQEWYGGLTSLENTLTYHNNMSIFKIWFANMLNVLR
jgi:hypothetical protein